MGLLNPKDESQIHVEKDKTAILIYIGAGNVDHNNCKHCNNTSKV